jgi:hypothetical protein
VSSSEWIPVNEAVGEEVKSGQRGEFVFTPDASGMAVDVVAASKYLGLSYEVVVDDDQRYGPSPVPPTDVDDLSTTHNPRLEVDRELRVIVRNPSASDRFVAAQVRGVEQ